MNIPRSTQSIDLLFNVAKKFKPSGDVFPIGIMEFDRAMDGGVRDGELVTVSGPTGQGKTTFLQNLSINFHQLGVPTLWLTYEMNPWYLKEKFVSMGHIHDTSTYAPDVELKSSMGWISDIVKEAVEDYACKIILIDHLHYLIPLGESKNSSLLIGGIVRELKKIAVKHNVIIFLIAHTKKIYQDEELDLSSVRDSSLVVQESDYVFLVERVRKEKPEKHKLVFEESSDTEWTNVSKVKLAKNRRKGVLIYKKFNIEDGRIVQEEVPAVRVIPPTDEEL